ncbi:hypothetical protein QO034_02135 [Sedimentitalea sp. JM2-8]|uniref:Uncharacterized protein n=1 Tax=Sedimentitalea xiamensis TaxID=3050037 RepID=A0ABT7FA35_9RHOB|nr:hypothetical protein [Sedimentitalea xiamensis]MDK3071898.1 hypothetical protein [Sedimentitalea xiamensis]
MRNPGLICVCALVAGGFAQELAAEDRSAGQALGLNAMARDDSREFRYWVNENLGVGAHAEPVEDVPDGWVVGVPVTVLVGKGWEFLAMPGAEVVDGDTAALIRLGAGYAFEFDAFDVRPGIEADFVEGDLNYAIGANLVFSF